MRVMFYLRTNRRRLISAKRIILMEIFNLTLHTQKCLPPFLLTFFPKHFAPLKQL